MEYQYSNRTNSMKPSIIREILKQMGDPQLISFAGGNPSAEAFPVEEIRRISEELLREDPVGALQYSITEGDPALRQVGEAYLNQQYPIKKEADDLIITSGSQQVMDFLTKLLCNEGDVVATEDPAFLGALNSFRSFGATLVGVQMEEDGVNIAALEAVFTATPKPKLFYTIPNFQNPTGVTTSLAKRKAIYALAKKHGVLILEDNPYGELRIAGQAIAPIKALDQDGLVVYAASLSKILAPGLRVAFCVGPKQLLTKMVVAKQSNDVHTNVWAQRVCQRFLTQCDMQQHLVRLQAIYREKAEYMMAQIDEQLGTQVQYLHPQGGMFLWLTLPAGVNMQTFVKKCLAKKLALVPGNAFFVDDAAPCQSVRVNFSTPSRQQIQAGVAIMAQVLAEMNS
ncbi:PLP-dependent aminotransferase family protein [Ruminococcaceae bacterium OttesenSCG-928-A16]|nr:PLP-dependent aminotransferase family protein [Ruminococcaceae bacterium OttesenSCG-928-A16]